MVLPGDCDLDDGDSTAATAVVVKCWVRYLEEPDDNDDDVVTSRLISVRKEDDDDERSSTSIVPTCCGCFRGDFLLVDSEEEVFADATFSQ